MIPVAREQSPLFCYFLFPAIILTLHLGFPVSKARSECPPAKVSLHLVAGRLERSKRPSRVLFSKGAFERKVFSLQLLSSKAGGMLSSRL